MKINKGAAKLIAAPFLFLASFHCHDSNETKLDPFWTFCNWNVASDIALISVAIISFVFPG